MSQAVTGARVATFAALAWVALGVDSIVRPAAYDYRDICWLVPFTATAAAFCRLHAVQRSIAGRSGRYAFYAVMAASALVLIGMFGIIGGIPELAMLGFPGGAIIWTVGLIWFGIATWRAGVFPRYVGIALILFEPGSILTGVALSPISPLHDHGGYSAGVEKGAIMALLVLGFRAALESDHAVRNRGGKALSMAG